MFQKQTPTVLESDAVGFAVSVGKVTHRARWNDVETVTVFKRDLYIVDQICLLLALEGGLGAVQVTESDDGYQAFLTHMEAQLPGILITVEWLLPVMIPAFAPNTRCIFRRGGSPDEAPAPQQADVPPRGRLRTWIAILTGF